MVAGSKETIWQSQLALWPGTICFFIHWTRFYPFPLSQAKCHLRYKCQQHLCHSRVLWYVIVWWAVQRTAIIFFGYCEQVQEKYLALKKDAKAEVVAEFEEVCFPSEHTCSCCVDLTRAFGHSSPIAFETGRSYSGLVRTYFRCYFSGLTECEIKIRASSIQFGKSFECISVNSKHLSWEHYMG